MKEKWKVIEKLLKEEYHIEVQGSYEGWGAGYDPKFLPLTEMWARGEMEDVPEVVKKPVGVVFHIQELSTKHEEDAINTIRHEIEYILNTDLYLWKLGQREFYKFGFTPTSFLVLYSILESIKVDQKIISKHPSSFKTFHKKYMEVLKTFDTYYPHHIFALSFVKLLLKTEQTNKDMERFIHDYLKLKNEDAYNILIEDLLGKYMTYMEKAYEINYIDLLIDEARGRIRKDSHKGRIMTDLLKKLPESLQSIIMDYKDKKAIDIPETERKEILKSLKNMPEWMKEYIKQMSYIDIIERDVEFIKNFIPKTLEVDIEHRGFISFVIKGWEDISQSLSENLYVGRNIKERTKEDRLYEKTYGLNLTEFTAYREILSRVLPHVEAMKRKLKGLMPTEEESWSGKHFYGKKLNNKSLAVEISTLRGKIYMRKEEAVRKELAFKLIIDVSTSMKREEKIKKSMEALILFSEVIDSMRMPFSIEIFNDRILKVKEFNENYKNVKGKIISIFNLVGGGTNLEKAILHGFDDINLFCLKNNMKGCIIVFSDGEPTRGLRGKELKNLISQIKAKIPVICVGMGIEKNYVDYYFEGTGIKIKDVADMKMAFTRIIENQAKRLLAFQ
ncbi:MAG: VWA domain-containing protein [Aquificaceae bacterium]|nr:VWA domain-containing protein [Aquificaceae bacterium]